MALLHFCLRPNILKGHGTRLESKGGELKSTVWRQDFYTDVEPIRLAEPLAHLLGAQSPGDEFVFHFTDAILTAGHSCPAVSGAYKLTAKALKALYKDELPVRGEIQVLIKGGPEDLAYGPQAQVISLITGASGATGFKGLGGRFSRKNKLLFDPAHTEFNTFIFSRADTGAAVKIQYNPQAIKPDPRMSDLSPLVMKGTATKEEHDLFISLWQGNVRKILLEDDKFPGLFTVEKLTGFKFPNPEGL